MKEFPLNETILYNLHDIKKYPKMFNQSEITDTSIEIYFKSCFRAVEHYPGMKLEDKIKRWYEEK